MGTNDNFLREQRNKDPPIRPSLFAKPFRARSGNRLVPLCANQFCFALQNFNANSIFLSVQAQEDFSISVGSMKGLGSYSSPPPPPPH